MFQSSYPKSPAQEEAQDDLAHWDQHILPMAQPAQPQWNPVGNSHPSSCSRRLPSPFSLTFPSSLSLFPYNHELGKKSKFTLQKKETFSFKAPLFWVPDKAIFSMPVGIWKNTLTQPSHHDSNNNYKMSNKTCM